MRAREERHVARARREEVGVGKELALGMRGVDAELREEFGRGRSSRLFVTSRLSRNVLTKSANVAPSTTVSEVCVTSPCVSFDKSCGSVMPEWNS